MGFLVAKSLVMACVLVNFACRPLMTAWIFGTNRIAMLAKRPTMTAMDAMMNCTVTCSGLRNSSPGTMLNDISPVV